jgi:hypothetical protein
LEAPIETTYWSEVGSGFTATVKGIGSFFKSVFKYLIIALPVLVVLAVIGVIALAVMRKRSKTAMKPPSFQMRGNDGDSKNGGV